MAQHDRFETTRAGAEPGVSCAGGLLIEPPAYDGGSIVNLMASIIAASGGTPRYAKLDGLDTARLADARHIVLIVVDGLGYEFLRLSRAGRLMRGHLKQGITTVYPPTTATAITSFLTGLAPQQHGITGWFMYFKELGSIVSVLPFSTRLGGTALPAIGVTAQRLLGHTAVFDTIERAGFCVSPWQIADSEFNRAHTGGSSVRGYGTLWQFVDAIDGAVRDAGAASFVYAYWPELDRLAHANGIASHAVQEHLQQIDSAYEELLDKLAGTGSLVLLTADHGFVDIAPESVVHVAEHPALRDALEVPLCGEPRTAYCYVPLRHHRRFVDYVGGELSDRATCVESAMLVERGFFGPGPAHPRLLDRIGQYTLLMHEGFAIQDALPGEERFVPLGMHGGGTRAELDVPLLVAET